MVFYIFQVLLHKIAKEEKIQLRRTYVKEIKEHRIKLRFFRHPKKIKKAKVAMKRLKTITGILIRDLKRNMNEAQLQKYQETFELFLKVSTKNKKTLVKFTPFTNNISTL